jgi:predicted NUDIX family NTP pyrophosphohydrolase
MFKKRYAGVLVKCNDKVLLCKRNNHGSFPGMWSIPCGRMEEGEEPMEASKREFITRKLTLMIYQKDLDSIDFYELEDFIKSICF